MSERADFETDALALGYDVARGTCKCGAPCCDYADSDAGHRWAGWLARANRTPLSFAQIREANVIRCAKWHPAGIGSWSSSDWMTAIVGELGELASFLKMRNRERDGLPGNKFSPTDAMIAKEMADVFIYLDLLAAAHGIDLAAAVVSKFNEVSERVGFPDRIVVP